ncbi:hypothetical protein LLS1_18270 [Leifsonia sp. LS1]|uniref:hypothetical protein n=1 Tax=Leifsonia sp. LS1 TaxID=2828483 RepID=UPI001CFE8573|nr:hypothetical protein [Leifsonia sp. LS1]GIT80158.1 hypothetical protein LLS1_18270 [Leifsonia sp. LS1]
MKFLVDFQAARDDGRITASLDYHLGSGLFLIPEVGQRVAIDDGEDHSAFATVRGVRGRLVDMVIDWDSWRDAAEPQPLIQSVNYRDENRGVRSSVSSGSYA